MTTLFLVWKLLRIVWKLFRWMPLSGRDREFMFALMDPVECAVDWDSRAEVFRCRFCDVIDDTNFYMSSHLADCLHVRESQRLSEFTSTAK